MQAFRLDGRVAIVTGATRGIGLAIAKALGSAGAKIVIASRKAEHVEAAVKEIEELRVGDSRINVLGIAANMGEAESVQHLAESSIRHFGGVDIVVNNAATNPVFGPLQQTDDAAFNKIFAVNVNGPLQLCKHVHTSMASRGHGSIVNISSIGGRSPEPGLGLYSVSKAALISLTKVMAQEWGAEGIRANVICPGLIKTKFSAALWKDEKLAKYTLRHQSIQRLGEPEDMAGLALFLASDASSYCTGGVYMADGGYSI
ncbi:MAG: SDR family oxidoreductase [Gemmatimonadaceae bacterium]